MHGAVIQGEDPVPPAVTRQLRLLSYNIQAGTSTRGYADYVTRSWKQVLPNAARVGALDDMAKQIARFDIVGLQESDAGSLRSGFINQTKYLAQHAGFPYWYHQPNRRVGKIVYASNGLLSHITPTEISEHRLPGTIPGRGALCARFDVDGYELLLVVVHLALGRRARRQQFDYVAELVSGVRHVVVMGDLNCTSASPELTALSEASGLRHAAQPAPTFPSWRPQRDLDHVLVSADVNVTRTDVLDLALSDHRPVAVELELGG